MTRAEITSIVKMLGYSNDELRLLDDYRKTRLYERIKKVIFEKVSTHEEYSAGITMLCDVLEY